MNVTYECGLSMYLILLHCPQPSLMMWNDKMPVWYDEVRRVMQAGDTALGDYWPSDNMSEGESSEVTETVKNEPIGGGGGYCTELCRRYFHTCVLIELLWAYSKWQDAGGVLWFIILGRIT